MYFSTKSYLKNTRNYTAKQVLKFIKQVNCTLTNKKRPFKEHPTILESRLDFFYLKKNKKNRK